MNRVALALFACLFVAACSKTPQTPSPTVSTLALSPATDLIRIKATEKFSAAATYSSGAVEEKVTAAWASDNNAVATVDASGTVTGVASGQANITASFQGKTATRTLRVVPDYTGTWEGMWTVTSCQVQGNLQPAWCTPLQGNSFPATIAITQTRDVVSATWTFQESNGTHPGTIATDGRLTLTGETLQNGVTISITSWQTISTDNRTMTGTFTLTWANGSAVTQIALANFNKHTS